MRPKAQFVEGELMNLTPTSGNIHCLYANEDTVLIEVVTPHFSQNKPPNFYEMMTDEPVQHCNACIDILQKEGATPADLEGCEIVKIKVNNTDLPSAKIAEMDIFSLPNQIKISEPQILNPVKIQL